MAPGMGLGFFSATFTKGSKESIDSIFSKLKLSTVLRYEIKAEELKLDGIRQLSKQLDDSSKGSYCSKLLKAFETDSQTIIFVNTKKFANMIYEQLKRDGHKIALLIGGMAIQEREKVLNDFRKKDYSVLISTNLLARGFDQRTIGLVINLDIPTHYGAKKGQVDLETYLHRIGRTGRFGDCGLALNLYVKDADKNLLKTIEDYYKVKIEDLNNVEDSKVFDRINDLIGEVRKLNDKKRADNKEKIEKGNN
mmetsp:Transcript_40550/g.35979  ORF Transcript_40550/g.35979 Transcript_40550/m.35979 type:complete len:251 (+) Transcript_40550:723-1475(+)